MSASAQGFRTYRASAGSRRSEPATLRARYRRRCRRAAWLGVFALLFQAWLPLVHHPATLFAPDGEETAAFAQLFGQTLVLCTAAGPVQEKVPPGHHLPAHRPPSCPICQSLHALGSFTPPAAPMLAAGSSIFRRYVIWPNAPGHGACFELAARPRAPPLPV